MWSVFAHGKAHLRKLWRWLAEPFLFFFLHLNWTCQISLHPTEAGRCSSRLLFGAGRLAAPHHLLAICTLESLFNETPSKEREAKRSFPFFVFIRKHHPSLEKLLFLQHCKRFWLQNFRWPLERVASQPYCQPSIQVIKMSYCLILFPITSPSENTPSIFQSTRVLFFYQLPLNQLLKSPLWNLRFHINDNSIAALQGIDAAGTTAIINSRKELGQTVNKPIREERVTWLQQCLHCVIKQLKASSLWTLAMCYCHMTFSILSGVHFFCSYI